MFCDQCGSQMHERDRFCPSCGKAFTPPAGPAPPPATPGRDLAHHLRILGVLWIVYSVIHLIPSGFLAAMPMRAFWSHPVGFHWALFPSFLGMFGLLFSLLSVLGIIAGVGLLHHRPWARTMAMIFACFALFAFPIGTALGIYTLWALAPSDSERQYRQLAH